MEDLLSALRGVEDWLSALRGRNFGVKRLEEISAMQDLFQVLECVQESDRLQHCVYVLDSQLYSSDGEISLHRSNISSRNYTVNSFRSIDSSGVCLADSDELSLENEHSGEAYSK